MNIWWDIYKMNKTFICRGIGRGPSQRQLEKQFQGVAGGIWDKEAP